MSAPDFDRMTKDEIIAWFKDTNDLTPILTAMTPATEPATRPADTPMMLASIRLPVELVEQLDNLAALHGMRRSDVIRDALTAYVADRTNPVDRDDAVHALEVIRRIVANHVDLHGEAA